jgi:hypothetical protein
VTRPFLASTTVPLRSSCTPTIGLKVELPGLRTSIVPLTILTTTVLASLRPTTPRMGVP